MKKIIDIKNISMKEKIALLATIAVLLMFITKMCYNLTQNDTNGIDYSKQLDIEYMIRYSEKNTDRQIDLILEDIISNFINSYSLELEVHDIDLESIKYKRKDYYKVLASDYKKKLGWFKYNSLSKEFMKKFICSNEMGQYMKSYDIVNKIYELNSYAYSANMYLCKLNTVNHNDYVYIGIQLDDKNNNYNIFYLGLGGNVNE